MRSKILRLYKQVLSLPRTFQYTDAEYFRRSIRSQFRKLQDEDLADEDLARRIIARAEYLLESRVIK